MWNNLPIHFTLGVLVSTLTFFIVAGGMLQRIQSVNSKWNTKRILQFRAAHRYLGFLFILLGQITVATKAKTSMWVVLVVFVVVLLFLEFKYRQE